MPKKEKNVHNLTRMGKRSLGVTLPIEYVRGLGWREKQRVRITRIKAGLVIRDYRNKK